MTKKLKSVFDSSVRDELIHRINSLHNESESSWGKMNVLQMLQHCKLADEMMLNHVKYRRNILSYLLGPMMLRKEMKDDRPLQKNTPTVKQLKNFIRSADIEPFKKQWINKIMEYATYSKPDYI